MNSRKKVHADRILGRPLAWGLNLAARILGKVSNRNHSIAPADVHTIVIAKYVGMGSILQATPLIRSIKAQFPDARIIFLTGRSCKPLVERLELIDKILTVDDRSILQVVSSTLRTIAVLIREKVDLFFDLEIYSTYGSIMSLLSLSRDRIGFYRESAEHKVGIYTHLIYFNTRNPIRYIYLQLGRAAGCAPVEPDQLGRLRVDEADRQELRAVLAGRSMGEEAYIAVNPNASDLLVERRWPKESFAELIGILAGKMNETVLLIGGPNERDYVATVAALVPAGASARVHNLAGSLSLGGLLALLERARSIITNDTGPMHMAWALATPSVCLFGPVDPAHYGWTGPGVRIVYQPVYCSPCLHQTDEPPCHGDNVCMQRIQVAQVLDAVRQLSAVPVPDRPPVFEPGYFVTDGNLPLGRVIGGSIEEAGTKD